MGYTQQVIDEVREKLAPSDETLSAARERRDAVLDAASKYPGTLRTYISGSIAHRVANDDTDADCGVVLDRRTYPELGPDGEGVGPKDIVDSVREFVRKEIKDDYPDVSFRVTKRAIKVSFNDPLEGGTDPTVDLIVALNRKDGALWIPNRDTLSWDASDPECHTRLLTAEPATLRRTRARVIRLAKGWNKQYTEPGLSGFNISALALKAVQPGVGVAEALAAFYEFAAADLAEHRTPDPAGVSGPIKVLIKRETMVKRLGYAAQGLRQALDNDDDEETVRDALADVYHLYVERPPGRSSRGALADALRTGNAGVGVVSGGLALRTVSAEARAIKTTRSFGD